MRHENGFVLLYTIGRRIERGLNDNDGGTLVTVEKKEKTCTAIKKKAYFEYGFEKKMSVWFINSFWLTKTQVIKLRDKHKITVVTRERRYVGYIIRKD